MVNNEDAGSWRNDPDIKVAAELLRKQRPLRKSSFQVAFALAYDKVIQKSMLKKSMLKSITITELK